MRRVHTLLVLALLLVAGLPSAAAFADGDPASDILIAANEYYPYQPPVSKAAARDLKRVTAASRRAGAPLKVAIIASQSDLGAVPDFFGRPQEYAQFLGRELRLVLPKQRYTLLVVMPAGFGVFGRSSGPRALDALRGIEVGSGESGDDLAVAASLAGQRLAAASGHPFPPVVTGTSKSGNTHAGRVALISVELLALLLGVSLAAKLRQRRPGHTAPA
jgi:hypothetical protein